MSETSKKITLDVIKRNGRKVDFDASKIALAIKKGFDDVNKLLESTDVNKSIILYIENSFCLSTTFIL